MSASYQPLKEGKINITRCGQLKRRTYTDAEAREVVRRFYATQRRVVAQQVDAAEARKRTIATYDAYYQQKFGQSIFPAAPEASATPADPLAEKKRAVVRRAMKRLRMNRMAVGLTGAGKPRQRHWPKAKD